MNDIMQDCFYFTLVVEFFNSCSGKSFDAVVTSVQGASIQFPLNNCERKSEWIDVFGLCPREGPFFGGGGAHDVTCRN